MGAKTDRSVINSVCKIDKKAEQSQLFNAFHSLFNSFCNRNEGKKHNDSHKSDDGSDNNVFPDHTEAHAKT